MNTWHLEEVGAAIGAITVVLGAAAYVGRKVRRVSAKFTAAADAVLGREAITDPITGVEIAPALPGIGVRMAIVESSYTDIAGTVANLSIAVATLTSTVERLARELDHRAGSDG